jgi:two-component system LytT family sensor kinase
VKTLKHIIFWVLLTIYACIIDPVHGTIYIQAVGTSLIMIGYIFIYYTESIFIFPRFYKKRKSLFFALFLTFMMFHIISYLNFQYFMENHKVVTSVSGQPLWKTFISEIILFGITSIMALGIYQRKINIDKIKSQSEKENVILIKEIGLLKNQFNSHITFNFLNYCYSKVHKQSPQTAEAMEIFSKMLRYSLNSKVNEFVLLKAEIEYIEDYIKLQKLLTTEIQVQFLIHTHNYNSFYIVPRVLITLIENAFKHGDLNSTDEPIRIELNIVEGYLHFFVKNKKSNKKIIETSGIGHNNLKEQLELFYKDKYVLDREDNGITYASNLKILFG